MSLLILWLDMPDRLLKQHAFISHMQTYVHCCMFIEAGNEVIILASTQTLSLEMSSYDMNSMTNSSLIYSSPPRKCSGVEYIPSLESRPPHVVINLDTNNSEIEDFDHIDELIMYFHRPPASLQLFAANGSFISTYGQRLLTLDLGRRRVFRWPFIIAEVSQPIIGADFPSPLWTVSQHSA
ncbi:hypothetical protein NPIL_558591 [Nephila pilipes]|uniref:Uncharacterized protein n=1 Tax=Nephila pilipes TaxID=299642 RepID=A0A8X6IC31_NEPPI|nr:hypothetical protein NPIL_558591 [Nephila pilipes]